MKNVISFISLLLLSLTIYSQVKTIDKFDFDLYHGELSNKDFFKKADFIFEAEYVKSESFLSDDSTIVYTVSVLNINEIYKGNNKLQKGTVQLVLDAGSYTRMWSEKGVGNAFMLDYRLNSSYNGGGKNIFFCIESDFPESPFNFETENKIDLKLLKNELYANLRFESSMDYNFTIYGLDNLYFKDIQEFYDYAKQFKGIDVPANSDKKKAEQKTLINEFLEKQNELLEIAKKNEQFKDSKANNITISIANQTVTGSGPYYFEFDVRANTNNSTTYYHSAISRLNFNTAVFGTDIVANENIQLTRNNSFSSTTYETTAYDVSSTQINIGLTARYGITSWNRTLLTTTPKILFHAKIEIQQPALITKGDYANLVFTDISFTSQLSFFATSSNASLSQVFFYDNTYYTNPPNYLIQLPAAPVITTNFSTLHLHAGLGEVLTIDGSGFGTIKGEVWFKNAEDGGASYIKALEPEYITSWTDTQIKVLVPSYIKDDDGKYKTAGTGKIEVNTSTSSVAESSTILNIDYSITNHGQLPSYSIKTPYIAKLDCTNGLTFTLHENVLDEADAVECIEKALSNWSLAIGIDLILEKDALGNYVTVSNATVTKKNVIWFDNTLGSAMNTQRNFSPDMNGTTVSNYYRNFSNISISYNASTASGVEWSYQTTGLVQVGEISFYQAFLHEVGHMLGLGHVNDQNALMHYKIKDHDVPTAIIDLNTVSISTPKIAALNLVNSSKTINWFTPNIGKLGTTNHSLPIITASGSLSFCTGSVTLTSSYTVDNIWLPDGQTTQAINVNATKDISVSVSQHGCKQISAITSVIVCPSITEFKINNGAKSTRLRKVTLNNKCINTPTMYKAWETIEPTIWQVYPKEIKFDLSQGAGIKTVNFKVSNAAGESAISTTTIQYNPIIGDNNESNISDLEEQDFYKKSELQEIQIDNNLIIYPNPANNVIQINYSTLKNSTLEIIDVAGKIVYKQTFDNEKIDISHLGQGLYVIKISNEENIITEKFMKN